MMPMARPNRMRGPVPLNEFLFRQSQGLRPHLRCGRHARFTLPASCPIPLRLSWNAESDYTAGNDSTPALSLTIGTTLPLCTFPLADERLT